MHGSRIRKPPAMYRQDIYFAESSSGFHKIGVSQNAHRRMEQLSVPGVLDMKLLHTVPTMFARKTERLIHDALREYRVSSEWFKLPDELVAALREVEGEHDLLTLCGTFGE